jgi:hypothetical protein
VELAAIPILNVPWVLIAVVDVDPPKNSTRSGLNPVSEIVISPVPVVREKTEEVAAVMSSPPMAI